MQRAEVLKAAGEAVVDRGLNYGQPEDNFANIARMWNAHLRNRGLLSHTYGVEAFDVALMMANVKQVRIAMDPNHADSWVDFTGYGACGAEVAKAGSPANDDEPSPKSAYEATGSKNFHPVQVAGEQPIARFGFRIGETVNTKASPSGARPGVVVGFAPNGVDVRWPPAASVGNYSPDRLRHGP